jgi:hypothetical protein
LNGNVFGLVEGRATNLPIAPYLLLIHKGEGSCI